MTGNSMDSIEKGVHSSLKIDFFIKMKETLQNHI